MYYPKSQITSDLYTNGGEFNIQFSNENYIGYYFKTSDGNFYTGRNPNDRPNEKLIPTDNLFSTEEPIISNIPQDKNITLSDNPGAFDFVSINSITDVINYNILKFSNVSPQEIRFLPYYNPQLPTQQDYQIGEFRRYFCKKTNEYLFIEINQTQYTQLSTKDPQILWQLYQPFYLDWQLTGDKQQVYKVNRNNTELTITTLKLRGLNEYLKFDYTKYYQ